MEADNSVQFLCGKLPSHKQVMPTQLQNMKSE